MRTGYYKPSISLLPSVALDKINAKVSTTNTEASMSKIVLLLVLLVGFCLTNLVALKLHPRRLSNQERSPRVLLLTNYIVFATEKTKLLVSLETVVWLSFPRAIR